MERHDLELLLEQHAEHKEGWHVNGQPEHRQSKTIPALRGCPTVEVGRDFPITLFEQFRGFACYSFLWERRCEISPR